MGLSLSHIVLVLVVFLLLFGVGKLPKLMSELAQGIKSFRQGMREDDSSTMEETLKPLAPIAHAADSAKAISARKKASASSAIPSTTLSSTKSPSPKTAKQKAVTAKSSGKKTSVSKEKTTSRKK